MLAIGWSLRNVRVAWVAATLLFAALPLAPAAAAVRIGANHRTLGMGRLRDRFLALLHLRGESRLRCGLGRLRTGLGVANLGRVLRGGQVCQL